jgi:hypothetical protein
MSNDITYWSITEMRLVKKLHDFAYSSEIDTHNLAANLFDMKLSGESYSQLAYRVAHADLIASNTHSTIVEPGTEAQPQFAMVSSGQFVSAKLPATPW